MYAVTLQPLSCAQSGSRQENWPADQRNEWSMTLAICRGEAGCFLRCFAVDPAACARVTFAKVIASCTWARRIACAPCAAVAVALAGRLAAGPAGRPCGPAGHVAAVAEAAVTTERAPAATRTTALDLLS